MSKQDRQGARIVTDLERKYKFGESFAKIMGIAVDAQKTAEEAGEQFEGLDQKTIFNILTNNGKSHGLYRDDDGELYINASYIVAGILSSINGLTSLNLNTGELTCQSPDKMRIAVDSGNLVMYDTHGDEVFRLWNMLFGACLSFGNISAGNVVGMIYSDTKSMRIDGDEVVYKPGKKVLFTGDVSSSATFTVPGTANYDLFAVRLGTATETESTVVLAYKVGDTIRGVGGWSGSSTEYKELFFLSATFSDDTWTLVDAKSQELYNGSVSDAKALNVKEVIGII